MLLVNISDGNITDLLSIYPSSRMTGLEVKLADTGIPYIATSAERDDLTVAELASPL